MAVSNASQDKRDAKPPVERTATASLKTWPCRAIGLSASLISRRRASGASSAIAIQRTAGIGRHQPSKIWTCRPQNCALRLSTTSYVPDRALATTQTTTSTGNREGIFRFPVTACDDVIRRRQQPLAWASAGGGGELDTVARRAGSARLEGSFPGRPGRVGMMATAAAHTGPFILGVAGGTASGKVRGRARDPPVASI